MTQGYLNPVTWEFDAASVEYFPMLDDRPLVAGDWVTVMQPGEPTPEEDVIGRALRSVNGYLRSCDGRLERPTEVVVELDVPGRSEPLEQTFALVAGLQCCRTTPPGASFRIAVPQWGGGVSEPPEFAIMDFTLLQHRPRQYRLVRRQIAGRYALTLPEEADSTKTLWEALRAWANGDAMCLIQDPDGEWDELTGTVDYTAYLRDVATPQSGV